MKDIGIKKKKIKKAAIILITIYLLAYWIGTWNFCMGSGTFLHNTPFDYDQSIWYCKKYNLTGKVVDTDDGIYMEIKDSTGEIKYVVQSLNSYLVEIYNANKISDCINGNSAGRKEIVSNKRWGKIYKFSLRKAEGIFSSNAEKEKYKVTFVRK